MANRKKVILIIVVVILSSLAVFYMVKNHSKQEENGLPEIAAEQATFGLIDMDKAMQAHPQYKQLIELKKEYDALALESKKAKPVQIDTQPPSVDFSAIDASINQKKNEKIKQKIEQLNAELQKKELEIRKQMDADYQEAAQKIDDQYISQIFNLQLKRNTLDVTKETVAGIDQQIEQLKNEQRQKLVENHQKFSAKLMELMKPDHEKAKKELDDYAAEIEKDLVEDAHRQVSEIEKRNHLAMAEKTNELKLGMDNSTTVRDKLENKEKEISVLQDEIIKDIASKVSKIAIENKLDIVLTSVQVNISAMDITDIVIKEFRN